MASGWWPILPPPLDALTSAPSVLMPSRAAWSRRRLTACRGRARVQLRAAPKKEIFVLETVLRVLGRKTPVPSNASNRATLASWIRCAVSIGRCA